MPVHGIVQGVETNIGGLEIGDCQHPLLGTSQILISANGNNPPTVKAGTKFYVYKTKSYSVPGSPATGNNVYPAGQSLTYLNPDIVFELVDEIFAWGSGNFPTIANSTVYWLYCTGGQDVDSTSRGKGIYGVSTNAPTYDAIKQGWYSADGLVIARFATDGSGNVINIHPITNELYKKDRLAFLAGQTYNGVALNVTATNGTVTRGVLIPYQTIDGSWRLNLNIAMTFSPASGTPTITIAGITAKNITNYDQAVSVGSAGLANTLFATITPNTGTIPTYCSAAFTKFSWSADVELDSKPTWAY